MSGGGGSGVPMASNRGQQQQQQQMGMQPQGMFGSMPQMDQATMQSIMDAMKQMQVGGLQPEQQMGQGIGALMPVNNAPPQQDPNQVDMRPTNMQNTGIGYQTAYRPTMGPIMAQDAMNANRMRPQQQAPSLPGSISNNLPPSLKRPTQGGMKGMKP